MQLYTILIIFLCLFVGLLMGLTGAGGGILSVPLLIYVMGLPFYEATPIALASVATSAFIGAYLAFRSKILRYKAAMLMSAIGLATAPLGLAVANLTPEKPLIVDFYFYSSLLEC